jgi:hypothetical protein
MTEACMVCKRQIPLDLYDAHGEECVAQLVSCMQEQQLQRESRAAGGQAAE